MILNPFTQIDINNSDYKIGFQAILRNGYSITLPTTVKFLFLCGGRYKEYYGMFSFTGYANATEYSVMSIDNNGSTIMATIHRYSVTSNTENGMDCLYIYT